MTEKKIDPEKKELLQAAINFAMQATSENQDKLNAAARSYTNSLIKRLDTMDSD